MNLVYESDLAQIISRIEYHKCDSSTFLITGANGFLASVMVDTLMYLNERYLEEKCTIITLCRNKVKAERKFGRYLGSPYFKLYIQGVEKPLNINERVDYIIHAASSAVTNDFSIIPADVLNANIVGTYNLLEFSKEKKLKGFLFFSSGAVYGSIPEGILEISEEDTFPLAFAEYTNCYAEGKRAGEALCKSYWKQFGIPTRIVRISHTYGPGINLYDGRVFSDFVKNICNKQNLVITGTGNDVRPFCYITDAIVAFFKILFYGENGEPYNMANRKETVTINELADILVHDAFPERKLLVIRKNNHSNVNIEKIKVNTEKLNKLGWKPEIGIIEGFQRTVRSFEEGER